ncbi:hypothetical protein HWV62_37440 [Athelia sp. TMB]|nr:hypothetical protein HWV62_37440 [Athelia sp. TMB]
MKEVSAFFHTVSVWAANAGSTTWLVNDGELGNRAAFHGPRTLLVCYQERDLNKLIDYVRGGERFFSGPFERVQTSRQKGQTQQSATQKAEESRRIVEHAVGASDACRRCGVVKGLDLFNESNWDLLQGVLGLQMSLLLPGRLPLNSTEVNKLREATCGITYAQIVAQLFRSKEIPFEELTERDWLCDVCVKDFIKHHFCRWWLDHKREGMIVFEI